MPFRSEAQRRYLYANHPEIAREFEAHTPKGEKLPRYKSGSKAAKRHTKVRRGLKRAFPD